MVAASRHPRRQRWRRAGGECPQREAETPQQEGRTPLPRDPTRGFEPRTPTAGCCRGGPPSGDTHAVPVPGRATPWAAGASYGRAGSPEKAAKRRREAGAGGAHFFGSRIIALQLPTSGSVGPQQRCTQSDPDCCCSLVLRPKRSLCETKAGKEPCCHYAKPKREPRGTVQLARTRGPPRANTKRYDVRVNSAD